MNFRVRRTSWVGVTLAKTKEKFEQNFASFGARSFHATRKAIPGSATPRKSLSFRSGCRRSLAPPQRKRETSKIRGICRICFGILKFVEFAGFVGFVVNENGKPRKFVEFAVFALES